MYIIPLALHQPCPALAGHLASQARRAEAEPSRKVGCGLPGLFLCGCYVLERGWTFLPGPRMKMHVKQSGGAEGQANYSQH